MSFDQPHLPPTPPLGPEGTGPHEIDPRRRSLGPLIAAVAVVVIGLTAFIILRAQGGAAPTATPTVTVTSSGQVPTGPSTRPPSSSRTGTVTPAPATTAPSAPAESVLLPVYYVDEVSGVAGPRLYREFRSLTLMPAGKVATALQAMISLPPSDPDYATLWPAGTLVKGIAVTAGVATVDLTAYPSSLGSGSEAAAVSQLVYTVTAADPSITGVKVRVNGAVPPSGHLDLTGVQSRGNPLDDLANVWILAPTQGLSTGTPVTVKVYGTGFEGNVPLKVFRGATEVTSTQVTTMMGGFAEAQTTITLPPGTYELRAYNDNGMDATLQLWDSKTFTVT